MNKILFMLFTLLVFVGCNKDEEQYFETSVDAGSISFEPIKGGALMRYNIPESGTIYRIQVTYANAVGQEMTLSGTYGSTELKLKGFFGPESSVPAKVSYVDRNNVASKPLDVTFSTLSSTAVSVFDEIKIEPYWGGFSVRFEAPVDIEGMVNIGYMGISPITGEYGIIIKETKPMSPGKNELSFSNITDEEKALKVVVWTEDFLQNEAKRVIYDVTPKKAVLRDNSKFTYTGNSFEQDDYYKIGWKYLFDGDKNCINQMKKKDGDYLFATLSQVPSKPSGIIDIQEAKVLAFLRLYAPLNVYMLYYGRTAGVIDQGSPNHIRLYASNDKDAKASDWELVGEYNQSKSLDEVFWWCYPQFDPNMEFKILENLENANSCYVDISFNASDIKYRYVKIEFLDIYRTSGNRRAICNEIEIFTGE